MQIIIQSNTIALLPEMSCHQLLDFYMSVYKEIVINRVILAMVRYNMLISATHWLSGLQSHPQNLVRLTWILHAVEGHAAFSVLANTQLFPGKPWKRCGGKSFKPTKLVIPLQWGHKLSQSTWRQWKSFQMHDISNTKTFWKFEVHYLLNSRVIKKNIFHIISLTV